MPCHRTAERKRPAACLNPKPPRAAFFFFLFKFPGQLSKPFQGQGPRGRAGLLKILLLSDQSCGNLEDLIVGHGPGDLLPCHAGDVVLKVPHQDTGPKPGAVSARGWNQPGGASGTGCSWPFLVSRAHDKVLETTGPPWRKAHQLALLLLRPSQRAVSRPRATLREAGPAPAASPT